MCLDSIFALAWRVRFGWWRRWLERWILIKMCCLPDCPAAILINILLLIFMYTYIFMFGYGVRLWLYIYGCSTDGCPRSIVWSDDHCARNCNDLDSTNGSCCPTHIHLYRPECMMYIDLNVFTFFPAIHQWKTNENPHQVALQASSGMWWPFTRSAHSYLGQTRH